MRLQPNFLIYSAVPVGVGEMLGAFLEAGEEGTAAFHKALVHPQLACCLGCKEGVVGLGHMDAQQVLGGQLRFACAAHKPVALVTIQTRIIPWSIGSNCSQWSILEKTRPRVKIS